MSSEAAFRAWFDAARSAQEQGTRAPFATLDTRTAAPLGSTSFMTLRPEHAGLEIGWTWLTPAWNTGANAEAKLLMMRYAFEQLACQRVEFLTHARRAHGEHSRRSARSLRVCAVTTASSTTAAAAAPRSTRSSTASGRPFDPASPQGSRQRPRARATDARHQGRDGRPTAAPQHARAHRCRRSGCLSRADRPRVELDRITGFGGPPGPHRPAASDVRRGARLADRRVHRGRDLGVQSASGPASTQLAIYCAYRVAGRRGALVGGLGFSCCRRS